MKNKKEPALFFTDGFVIDSNTIVISAQFSGYPDADVSTILLKFSEDWIYYDADDDMIRSITFNPSDGCCYLMGRNGIVYTLGGKSKEFTEKSISGTFNQEEIKNTSKFGELFRIRTIDDNVYVCGQSSQVYVRRDNSWEHMDQGILSCDAEALEDIDGTSSSDIYAVGLQGTIHHFDGRKWTTLDSPTNENISNVRCVSKDEVYLCGDNGILYRGNYQGWKFIGDPDIHVNFWGMEIFHNRIYVAHASGVFVHNGTKLDKVNFKLRKHISCHRIHCCQDALWSFGVDDILMTDDGNIWNEVICPENS